MVRIGLVDDDLEQWHVMRDYPDLDKALDGIQWFLAEEECAEDSVYFPAGKMDSEWGRAICLPLYLYDVQRGSPLLQ